MPVHGGRGNVGQSVTQLRGGQLTGSQQSLEDTHPDGVALNGTVTTAAIRLRLRP